MALYAADKVRQPPNRSLDVLRGLAAALVVLGHTREFLFLQTGRSADDLGALQKALLAPTSLAQESVAIFFVLSGFLVGGQVIREVRLDRFSWRSYLAKRLSRLWTVLLPGLALTLVLDAISWRTAGFERLNNKGSLAVPDLLCNVLFLQEARCRSYGSNESLWSLSYEFWFYIVFAAATIAVVATTRRAWTRALVGAALVVLSLALFGPDLLRLIPSWLFGVVLAVIVRRINERGRPVTPPGGRWSVPAAVVVLAVALVASNLLIHGHAPLEQAVRFVVVGLGACPLVLLLALYAPANEHPVVRAVSRTGAWSYSSYVYHAPILKLAIALVVAAGSTLADPVVVVAVYGFALVAYLLTIPLWSITERHTNRVRDALLRLLRVPPRPLPAAALEAERP